VLRFFVSSNHAQDWMRATVDELDATDGRLSRWDSEIDWLPFNIPMRVSGASQIWKDRHVRGNIIKWETSAATRYEPQSTMPG